MPPLRPAPGLRDRLITVLLLGLAGLAAMHPIFSYDLFWHLANGREIALGNGFAQQELFSYTQFGTPFDNHEWLAQWLFYRLFELSGHAGLLGLKILLVAATLMLLYRAIRLQSDDRLLIGLLCVTVILVGMFRLTIRPHLFSHLLLAGLWLILLLQQRRPDAMRLLWLIAPIMVTWDWLHGSIYGFLLAGGFLVMELLKPALHARWPNWQGARPLPPQQRRQLLWAAALTLLLMALNPLGLSTYGTFLAFTGDGLVSSIQEFAPSSWDTVPEFWVLLGVAWLTMLLQGRQTDPTQLVLLLGFSLIAARYSRATMAFAIVATPIVAANLERLQQRELIPAAWWRPIRWGLLLVVLGWWLQIKLLNDNSPQRLGFQFDEQFLPVASVRFVEANRLQGNLYNSSSLGGYLAYYLGPQRKIFQYNHHTVFPDPEPLQQQPERLDRWQINYAIINHPGELQKLFPLRDWARIYREPAAVVVVRRSPQNRQLIERYEVRLFHPMLPEERLRQYAANPAYAPRLLREMIDYLAYKRDVLNSSRLASLLADNPPLSKALLNSEAMQLARQRNSELRDLE